MSASEPKIIHCLRAFTLLGALIFVPGTAICWNFIPKDWHNIADVVSLSLTGDGASASEISSRKIDEIAPSSLFDGIKAHQTEVNQPSINPKNRSNITFVEEMALLAKQREAEAMDGVSNGISNNSENRPLSLDRFGESAFTSTSMRNLNLGTENIISAGLSTESEARKMTRSGSNQVSEKTFAILEHQLRGLGAKYYRLEKWGSKGELFRFSCYVSPSEPYLYQKYFQAIDSDELGAMSTVIREIAAWKNVE